VEVCWGHLDLDALRPQISALFITDSKVF
jgi:hypothetical protein